MAYHSLLCLGDSYTIGENVPLHESFPYQLVQMMRASGEEFQAPEIVAQTGWTTFELLDHLSKQLLKRHYEFVTLLIGVNNQYRNLSADDYKTDFALLLEKAIAFAGNRPPNVFVLSIPDWGVTPFAEGKNRGNVSTEIDAFNDINRELASDKKVQYISITESTRESSADPSLLTADQLHPSAKEYKK